MILITCTQFLLVLTLAQAANILIYSPSYTKSHLISNGRMADTLTEAGHNVVIFVPILVPIHFNATKYAKIIRMENVFAFEAKLDQMKQDLFTKTITLKDHMEWVDISAKFCEAILKRKDDLDQLREYNFDVGFSEQLEYCGVGIIRYLGIKNHIWVSSMPLLVTTTYTLGVPSPISYVPVVDESDFGSVMSFTERAFNLFRWLEQVYVHRARMVLQTEKFRALIDPNFPDLQDVAADSAICFVNTDEFLDIPRPILHKVIYVGGIGVSLKPSPLPEKFEKLMQKGDKGVVLFSLGTIVPSSVIPMNIRVDIIRAFSEFSDFHFLIRVDENDNETDQVIKDMGVRNVELIGWMPQSDLLGHPRMKLFIMHGGLNGMIETAIRGVPLLVIPFFGDQFHNGAAAEHRGIGLALQRNNLNYAQMKKALTQLLTDEKYLKAARRLSEMICNKPNKPEEQLIKWTNYVIKYGPLPELQVEGAKFSVIKYFGLDIFAALLLLIVIVLVVIVRIIRRLVALFRRTRDYLRKKDV